MVAYSSSIYERKVSSILELLEVESPPFLFWGVDEAIKEKQGFTKAKPSSTISAFQWKDWELDTRSNQLPGTCRN